MGILGGNGRLPACNKASTTSGLSSRGNPSGQCFSTSRTICLISESVIQLLLYFLNGVGHKGEASGLVNCVNEL